MTAAYLDTQPHLLGKWASLNPLGRIGRPDELRGVVTWLASDASTFCTGSEYVFSFLFFDCSSLSRSVFTIADPAAAVLLYVHIYSPLCVGTVLSSVVGIIHGDCEGWSRCSAVEKVHSGGQICIRVVKRKGFCSLYYTYLSAMYPPSILLEERRTGIRTKFSSVPHME